MKYNKPTITIAQQIAQLKSRDLIIADEPGAEYFLQNVSYYRLAGYWWPMLADKVLHTFKPNSTFENIIAIYNFDRELRLLLFGVIERIEIAFRTKLIYHLSHEVSPWWFEDVFLFKNAVEHTKTLTSLDRELQQTREIFITEHYKKYHTDTRRPPSWKTLEVVSFGVISKFYGNLLSTIASKDAIAAELGTVNHTFLPSWLQSIAQIRNICAHHGRLWNKHLPGRPKLLPKPPKPWIANVPPATEYYMLYVHLCCMKYLMNIINPGNRFTKHLVDLMTKYPNIDPNALGLKPNWQNEPLWLQ
ncbi:MAG: Abi family protein [Cytophagales bacterium]|nr:Abi family protein [Cytophagales bacterium]